MSFKKGEDNPNVVNLSERYDLDITDADLVFLDIEKKSILTFNFKEVSILRNTLTRWMNKNRRNNATPK